jgi:hypothetical protein
MLLAPSLGEVRRASDQRATKEAPVLGARPAVDVVVVVHLFPARPVSGATPCRGDGGYFFDAITLVL